VGNNASQRRTKVALENAMGLQTDYTNATPLAGDLKTAKVDVDGEGAYSYTTSALPLFLKVPANKQNFEKMSSQTAGSMSPSDVPVWSASRAYGVGDIVRFPANSTTLYRAAVAHTNSQPPSANWVAHSGPVPALLDGWSKAIAYIPGGGLTDMKRADQNNQTVVSPDGRPFWVSAGPDGDFQTHDDNVYSFEN
jgi:hypothetical protein